ncbi:sulfite exporter TauE/SafE family protein [Falsiroseomonas oryziterrae]|uniref:sulfite exporter TauE/SafE family protein n=1 Tax=Falsiroseomonas oryziterrae TaxID=2911368 RepID=UPI001F25A4E1|nr:sulfite exporter TauE/SafE family protein [Roseomonas sp. NPKOSM-4]
MLARMDTPSLALVVAVFLLAGGVKGLIGLGLPTISVGLLALFMPPAEAAALLVLPSLLTNIAQAGGPALRPLLHRLWPMLAGLVPGALLGGYVIGGAAALPALGVALLAYAAWGLVAPPLTIAPALERRSAVPVGLAGGVVTGATGVFVMPVVPWLAALGLPRDAMVQALGLGFLVATLALALSLAWQGALDAGRAGGSVLAVAPALAGQWIGMRLRMRLPPSAFRRGFFLALLALGAALAWRGVA